MHERVRVRVRERVRVHERLRERVRVHERVRVRVRVCVYISTLRENLFFGIKIEILFV